MATNYLKFEKEIKGTGAIDGRKDWIAFENMSTGGARSVYVTDQQRKIGTPHMTEISMTRSVDMASNALIGTLRNQDNLGKCTIHVMPPTGSGDPKVEYILENAIVSEVTMSGGDEGMTETLRISFTKITETFYAKIVKGKGVKGTPFSFDLSKSTEV